MVWVAGRGGSLCRVFLGTVVREVVIYGSNS